MRNIMRFTCVLVGLALIAGAATDLVMKTRAYDAWLDANASELGAANRAIDRYHRRLQAKLYREMPSKVERADAEAAELGEAAVARLEPARVALFEVKQRAASRVRWALVVGVFLFVLARVLAPREVARW